MRLLTEESGKKVLEYVREQARQGKSLGDAPLLQVLVSTRSYTGCVEPEWCDLDRIAVGDAAVYPVKAFMAARGCGQWSILEVLGVRTTDAGELALPQELLVADELEGPAVEPVGGVAG